MHWFRNVMAYNITQEIDLSNFEAQLQSTKYRPCGDYDSSKFGWDMPLITSESLSHQINEHILLLSCKETKPIPAEVIKKELNARVESLEKKENRKLTKVQRLSIKDEL